MQMIVQLCVILRSCENSTSVIRRKGPNRKESSIEDMYKFLDELGDNIYIPSRCTT